MTKEEITKDIEAIRDVLKKAKADKGGKLPNSLSADVVRNALLAGKATKEQQQLTVVLFALALEALSKIPDEVKNLLMDPTLEVVGAKVVHATGPECDHAECAAANAHKPDPFVQDLMAGLPSIAGAKQGKRKDN